MEMLRYMGICGEHGFAIWNKNDMLLWMAMAEYNLIYIMLYSLKIYLLKHYSLTEDAGFLRWQYRKALIDW
jgi:hypothetical protein